MKDEYIGIITNYRVGPRTQYQNQCLIKVLDVSVKKARSLSGWKVYWPAKEPKIKGRVIRTHGGKGVLRTRFDRGMPGQALQTRVKLVK
ncbi:MAG: 50S ribosomal protein L35ae [Candidatus Bathyarchaeia archaeon]